MTANKMPEMPAPIHSVEVFTDDGEQKTYQADADYYTADQMRAMYLAGIADARACVPDEKKITWDVSKYDAPFYETHNRCRETTLTNLTALESAVNGEDFPEKEEAKK